MSREGITPLSIEEAQVFLEAHGRHYKADGVPVFAIGYADHGAAIIGHRNGEAVLIHIYCDGVSEGYTMLYGAAWRAAKALGYKRMVL